MAKEKTNEISESKHKLIALTKANAEMDIDTLFEESVTDRQYSSKFKKMFAIVRKGLVVLKAKKQLKELTPEETYYETIALFERAKEL